MTLKVFAVFDSKIGTYAQPVMLPTRGAAERAWRELAKDKSTQIGQYPADFTLFQIAEYDDQTGRYENLHTPDSLGTALSALSEVQQ